MNLADCYYLATVIHASTHAQLLAIGRFVPTEQLTPESPWGCSVLLADGRRQTVWSIAEWCDLVARLTEASPAVPPVRSQPSLAPISTAPRPDAAHRRQPTLF